MTSSAYPEKYKSLIDEETWAFIEETNSWYPPDTVDYTVEQQRDVYNRMCRAFFNGYPEGIAVETSAIPATNDTPELPIRTYLPKGKSLAGDNAVEAIVVYFHGGGFVVGGLESHDDVCAEICDRTGFAVICPDYRLAPENIFPSDFNDATKTFDYASQFHIPSLVVGDSAGGNLSAAVSHASRGSKHQPAGQVLIYPGLGNDLRQGSFIDHAEAPMLTVKDMEFYKTARSGGDDSVFEDKRCAPLIDPDFTALPPTVVISAECDPLSDNGREYCDKVLAAGGNAIWFNEKGMVHGYLRARNTVTRAKHSFNRIIDAISQLGRGEWNY